MTDKEKDAFWNGFFQVGAVGAVFLLGLIFGALIVPKPGFSRDQWLQDCSTRAPLSDCMKQWDGK